MMAIVHWRRREHFCREKKYNKSSLSLSLSHLIHDSFFQLSVAFININGDLLHILFNCIYQIKMYNITTSQQLLQDTH